MICMNSWGAVSRIYAGNYVHDINGTCIIMFIYTFSHSAQHSAIKKKMFSVKYIKHRAALLGFMIS